MTPKKVWSIILIVLGVLSVIGSAASYHEIEVAGSVVSALDASTSKFIGHSSMKTSDIFDVQEIMKRKKILLLVGIYLGVLMSAIGTLMVKKTTPAHARTVESLPSTKIEDDIDTEIMDDRPFKL